MFQWKRARNLSKVHLSQATCLSVLRLTGSQVSRSCTSILRLLRIIVQGVQEIRLPHNPIVTFGILHIIKSLQNCYANYIFTSRSAKNRITRELHGVMKQLSNILIIVNYIPV